MAEEKQTIPDFEATAVMGTECGEPPSRILVVDDDEMIRTLLRKILEPQGYSVDCSEGSGDALEKLIDYKYHLLLLDAYLPGISGFELLKYCKKHHPMMEIIMITGNPELDDAISTVKDGAFDYIAKPFSIDKLLSRVKAGLEHQRQQMLQQLSITGSNIFGKNTEPPLPDYKVVRTLGTGTMGVVMLVEKESHQFALKILRREDDEVANDFRVKRFLREAEILAEINHENIVRIFESGFSEKGETPYILMEYVPGRPLTDFIKEDVLQIDQKISIISQVAAALGIVHKFGVLHRDVKPSNILVKDDLIAKLSDFGIARVADSSLTMTHEVLGSPAYMPPEMFKIGKPIDQRSDIFSLGILSYELITGVKPFQGETVGEMMGAIQTERPQEPRKLVPDLSPNIQAILGKMLRKSSAERYQRAEEIVADIKRIRANAEPSASKSRSLFSILTGGTRVWA